MSQRALEAAVAHLGGALIASHGQCGDETVVVKREALVGLMRHLKSAPALAFNQLVDVCGVDFLTFDHPRPQQVVGHEQADHPPHDDQGCNDYGDIRIEVGRHGDPVQGDIFLYRLGTVLSTRESAPRRHRGDRPWSICLTVLPGYCNTDQ